MSSPVAATCTCCGKLYRNWGSMTPKCNECWIAKCFIRCRA